MFTIKTTLLSICKPVGFRFSNQSQKRKFFKIRDQVKTTQPIVYPQQYPKNKLTDAQPIITRQRPVRFLTPKFQIPQQKLIAQDQLITQKLYNGKFISPQNAYTLNVGLIGPVNAGKSQLFGALAYHISAVSPKASTTTQIITGVKSFERETELGTKNVQIKYMDTPGLMYKKQGFLSKGWSVLSQIDFSLLVVDSAKRFDDMIKQSITRLQRHRAYPNFMKSLVLNKIDLVDNRRKFDSLIREIEKYGKFDKIFYVSAKTGYGVKQLQEYLLSMAKPGKWEYPPQAKSTMTQIQIIEQLLREAIFGRTYKQVPHSITVMCTSHLKKSNGKDQLVFDLHVDTENQQRMVIGTQGSNIQAAIKHFNLSYAKIYARESETLISVKIRSKFRREMPGLQQSMVQDQQQRNQQTIRVLEENMALKKATGKVRVIPKLPQA